MPTYTYVCTKCEHEQLETRSFVDRKEDSECEECSSISEYTLAFPTLHYDGSNPDNHGYHDRWVKAHEEAGKNNTWDQ